MNNKSLDDLIERARLVQMTPEQKEAQRRIFAYGNAHMSNPSITREDIDRAAASLSAISGGKVCEVCQEPCGKYRTPCEACGRMFGDCCNSETDNYCEEHGY